MSAIASGARQAVRNCVNVQPGEMVVIVTDLETKYLADAVEKEVLDAGAKTNMFIMEDFGERPEDGTNPLPFPEEIGSALAQAQVSFYMAQGKAGELPSFRVPMLKVAEKNNLRHAHMPNFVEEMMSQGMASDYAEIQALSKKVYDIVSQAKEIRITTPAGTDFTATFDPRYKWVISDGHITPGNWSNLPDGEVFTQPVSANGTVVVDGCFGDFFNKKYGDIGQTPLTYQLKDGRCQRVSVTCTNQALKEEFDRYTFETDDNSDRLGEFAIGTNVGLTHLIGNLLQDEKFPGIHLALGSPYPDKTGATWDSSAHNDGILRNPTIIVDGRTIMKDGKFTI
ncbi:MAG: aminopeptidase [Myxococcota bacterium]|nr:aminopeptidase [Myxococcota bacterium]